MLPASLVEPGRLVARRRDGKRSVFVVYLFASGCSAGVQCAVRNGSAGRRRFTLPELVRPLPAGRGAFPSGASLRGIVSLAWQRVFSDALSSPDAFLVKSTTDIQRASSGLAGGWREMHRCSLLRPDSGEAVAPGRCFLAVIRLLQMRSVAAPGAATQGFGAENEFRRRDSFFSSWPGCQCWPQSGAPGATLLCSGTRWSLALARSLLKRNSSSP